jgi:hypothetical protein
VYLGVGKIIKIVFQATVQALAGGRGEWSVYIPKIRARSILQLGKAI